MIAKLTIFAIFIISVVAFGCTIGADPTPKPTPTTDQTANDLFAYARACGLPISLDRNSDDFDGTWGIFGDFLVESMSKLEPPPGLEDYHASILATNRELRKFWNSPESPQEFEGMGHAIANALQADNAVRDAAKEWYRQEKMLPPEVLTILKAEGCVTGLDDSTAAAIFESTPTPTIWVEPVRRAWEVRGDPDDEHPVDGYARECAYMRYELDLFAEHDKAAAADHAVKYLMALSPPEELKDYHHAHMLFMRETTRLLRLPEADREAEGAGDKLIALMEELDEQIKALSDEVVSALRATGCFQRSST